MSELFTLLFSQLKKIPKQYFLSLGVGIAGLILFGYGLIIYFTSTKESINRENIPSNTDFTVSATTQTGKKSKVDVEGAVIKPGVYGLGFDTRVQDALIAAGGLSQDADRNWVERHINLAAKLPDGAKVYIPKIGEYQNANTAQTQQSSNTNTDSSGTAGSDTGSININTATADILDSLPGVGQITAQKIIAGRPYGDINDLSTKKIVNKKVFDEIKDKITIY